MKRREFSQAALGAVIVSTGLATSPLMAQSAKPVAGTNYQVLGARAPVEAPAGKVEVVEFFSYMCPHCNVFEPTFNAWAKRAPKDVFVRRVPVAFLQNFEVLQRLFFTLEAMGLVDKLHGNVFAAVHGERRNFKDAATVADWIVTQGVDRAKFMDQFNSFTTATKVTRAAQLTNAYKVEGVPALGVAGRFLTDGPMAGNMDRALIVVESLVGDVRSGK